ncbi:hypothetical protein JD844_028841 [Phrynosoma platyrhinos]|uniref:Lymphoid-restricted membrane protein n=1 Tax=Phrynosoma platyrhinos TaxID=52577 RepID=A0ABQ7SIE5_PHRPL|nr:hypothetical protein JD844_028841 [Phrynosoma platyrhinos]
MNKKTIWIQKLDLLNAQKESLDKELIKMAGNLRRMRTEQLHLKRALSSREQELESVKQLKENAVSEMGTLKLALQEATKQVEDANEKVKDLENNFHRAQEEASSRQKNLEECLAKQGNLQSANVKLTHVCNLLLPKIWQPRKPEFCFVPVTRIKMLELPIHFTIRCNHHSVGHQTGAGFASGASMDADLTKSDAGPLTDHVSSEPSPSMEAFPIASECTNGAQDMDPAVSHTTEGEVSEAALAVTEEEAASDAKEEAKQETQHNLAGGSSSPEDLSRITVCRNKQKTNVSPNEKEVESLASLSEDNQVQEIAKKLQKSLELLNQYASRIASKAEMLGAIHQESRVSKAVEVMIQHVENLKRTYTREHAELEELKGLLLQNEKSFGSVGDRDESSIKKLSGSVKPSSLRRVSIAPLPRNTGKDVTVLPLGQLNETDGSERTDKYNRRSSWGLVGAKQGEKRPLLQRYVSSPSWTESEEDQPEPENVALEPAVSELRGNKAQKLSEKENNPPKWRLHSLCSRFLSCALSLRTSFCKTGKVLCISVIVAVFIAVLSIFIVGFPFQSPTQAAPVGTGDAWTSVQQLLWPYTGLQHQGPPPV